MSAKKIEQIMDAEAHCRDRHAPEPPYQEKPKLAAEREMPGGASPAGRVRRVRRSQPVAVKKRGID